MANRIKNVDLDYDELVNTPAYIIKGDRYFFSYEKVKELLAMACEDVWPNGKYGDIECCLWGDVRRILCKENLKEWDV